MSSTRDIEIITFQILSYEMLIAVKQYFVTRQRARGGVTLQKHAGGGGRGGQCPVGRVAGRSLWGERVGFHGTQRSRGPGGSRGAGQRSWVLGCREMQLR